MALAGRNRQPVIGSFRFLVEIEGLLVGGFSEVSGIQSVTDVEEYDEGGVNWFTHQLPRRIKYPPLQLKRGMMQTEMWRWYEDVMKGRFQRKSGSIILQDAAGQEVCRWNFFEAYPVKWTGPDLNALQTGLAVEQIELVHQGWKLMMARR